MKTASNQSRTRERGLAPPPPPNRHVLGTHVRRGWRGVGGRLYCPCALDRENALYEHAKPCHTSWRQHQGGEYWLRRLLLKSTNRLGNRVLGEGGMCYSTRLHPFYSRARICKPFKEPRNRFPAWQPVRQPYLSYRPAMLHIGWRNRFLGSTHVYKYGLRLLTSYLKTTWTVFLLFEFLYYAKHTTSYYTAQLAWTGYILYNGSYYSKRRNSGYTVCTCIFCLVLALVPLFWKQKTRPIIKPGPPLLILKTRAIKYMGSRVQWFWKKIWNSICFICFLFGLEILWLVYKKAFFKNIVWFIYYLTFYLWKK